MEFMDANSKQSPRAQAEKAESATNPHIHPEGVYSCLHFSRRKGHLFKGWGAEKAEHQDLEATAASVDWPYGWREMTTQPGVLVS